MTDNEIVAKVAQIQKTMLEAYQKRELAFKAFEIACLRHDWKKAEEEQTLASEYNAAWMDAFQAIHRLAE